MLRLNEGLGLFTRIPFRGLGFSAGFKMLSGFRLLFTCSLRVLCQKLGFFKGSLRSFFLRLPFRVLSGLLMGSGGSSSKRIVWRHLRRLAQSLQNSLIKEYTLNYNRILNMI